MTVDSAAPFPSSQRRGGAAASRLARRGGQIGETSGRSSIEASPYRARASRQPVCAFAALGAGTPLRGGECGPVLLALVCTLWLHSVEALAGSDRLVFGLQAAYGLENGIPRNISHIQMLYAQPQVGIIVWDFPESRLLIKRFEIVSEGIIGGAIHPGGHLLGDTVMFRVSGNPRRKFIPFFNVSSGPLRTNLDEKAPELGGHVQFISQGGVGIQRRLNVKQSVVMEYRYFHMSNAGLTKPNPGFNGSMLSIGMRWNPTK